MAGVDTSDAPAPGADGFVSSAIDIVEAATGFDINGDGLIGGVDPNAAPATAPGEAPAGAAVDVG